MHGCSWTRHALLLLLAVLPLAAAQPWPLCDSSSGNYSAGSTYEDNLLTLVGNLRGDASSSKSFFASGWLGAPPNTVYGLMLCRGDLSFSDCRDCGTYAGRAIGTVCRRRIRDVALCYNTCYVRLSDKNFLASTNNSGEIPLISGNNINSNNVTGYNRALTSLLNATVQYAVDNSTKGFFATGEWVGPDPGFSHIYSLAQCTADLSPSQCRGCLQNLLAEWFTRFNMPRDGDGARVTGARCSLRSEVAQKPFYSGPAMLLLPAKAAAPGPVATAVPGTEDKKKNSTPVFLVKVIVPVVLIFLLVGTCIIWKLYRKDKKGGNQDYAMFEEETPLHIDIRRFTYAELKLITKNFASIIGKGGFGIVYHGILENGDEVAVKVLMETSIAESTDFLPEVQTLSKVHHKNLVTLQGYCQNKKCLALVYDFMPRGNLQQLLRGGGDYSLNWEQRLHIAFDAAQGLEYLHELCTPSIVHRDVKTPNILLDKNLVGIISDFGLSRAFNDAHTHISTVAAGTLGYLDPEYHATFQLTVKTDVYSFGIVLLEIITGQPPVTMVPQPVHLPNWVRQKIAKGSIHDVVDKRLVDQYNVSSLQSVIDIAMDCVENSAIDRPAMTEVVSRLKVWLPVVSSEKRSIDGSTQYKYTMDNEISKQYQFPISGGSIEGTSFQSGYTEGMSEISMCSAR